MRLSEAMEINGAPAGGAAKRAAHLVCGFMPLHLETFARARMRVRFPECAVELRTGLYGDLEGNLARAAEVPADAALVAIEWADIDQRLDLRSSAGWSAAALEDVAAQSAERFGRLERLLGRLAAAMRVALACPTLPLPPITHFPPSRTSPFEAHMRALLAEFMERAVAIENVRVVSAEALAQRSPCAGRFDAALHLHAGFPYTVQHADAVAEFTVECAFPAVPKKGIITDLDDTLWKGILGDAGVDGVSWRLDSKSQGHAVYQQMLASLADSGVLVGVASKNDPALVAQAFGRADCLLKSSQVFPVEASWGAKSDAVGRILKAWNIGADSVVFVDDSPMELAEVAETFPGIECLRFPADKPAAIVDLLYKLRALFGKAEIRDEDRLRAQSLRVSAEIEAAGAGEASEDFLGRLDARLVLDFGSDSGRAFELVNKTNQFNLNGRRFMESEWKSQFEQPGAFLMTASYEDRFGPLGKIAVIGGVAAGPVCDVDVWAMSCRAFSRRIEFQMLRILYEQFGFSAIRFRFVPTPRNGPARDFFRRMLGGEPPEGALEISAGAFQVQCPALFHQVTVKGLRERQVA